MKSVISIFMEDYSKKRSILKVTIIFRLVISNIDTYEKIIFKKKRSVTKMTSIFRLDIGNIDNYGKLFLKKKKRYENNDNFAVLNR